MKKLYTIILLLTCIITVQAQKRFYNLTAEELRIDSVLPNVAYSVQLPKNYQDSAYTLSIKYPEYINKMYECWYRTQRQFWYFHRNNEVGAVKDIHSFPLFLRRPESGKLLDNSLFPPVNGLRWRGFSFFAVGNETAAEVTAGIRHHDLRRSASSSLVRLPLLNAGVPYCPLNLPANKMASVLDSVIRYRKG